MDTDPLQTLPPVPPPVPRQRSAALPIVILVFAAVVFAIFWLRPAEQALEFEDFRLVYSYPWELIGTAHWQVCESEDLWDCDAALGSLYTGVLILRHTSALSGGKVAELEAASRAEWLEANETIDFIRVEDLTVGGQPAVARVEDGFAISGSSRSSRGYGMQIFVLNGVWLYEIDVISLSEEQFEQDRDLVMRLLDGFEFRHRIVEGNTQT